MPRKVNTSDPSMPVVRSVWLNCGKTPVCCNQNVNETPTAAISGSVKPRNTVRLRTRKDPTIGQTSHMIIVPRSAGKSKYEGLTISISVLMAEDVPFFRPTRSGLYQYAQYYRRRVAPCRGHGWKKTLPTLFRA